MDLALSTRDRISQIVMCIDFNIYVQPGIKIHKNEAKNRFRMKCNEAPGNPPCHILLAIYQSIPQDIFKQIFLEIPLSAIYTYLLVVDLSHRTTIF